MIAHLPILQVIIPFLGAPCALILGRSGLVWGFSWLLSLATFGVSILLLVQVMEQGVISYALGGWEAPWGIEYRIDAFNAFMLMLVSGVAAVVLMAARSSIEREIPAEKHVLFYVLFLLCLAGLLGILATGDVFNVFVFLEISALSSYSLVALGKDRRAVWSAFQYLVMGTIGATFILIGIGLLYIMTGTLNMADLAERLPALETTEAVQTAFAFLIVGISLKLAMFPLHFWLPGAYTYAPAIVSAFLAATATKVALYLLIRFAWTVFGLEWSMRHIPMMEIFLVLGVVAVFSASLVAVYQHNLKRLFAYSSVAQIGYMVIGLGLVSTAGLQASILHIFNHALMKGALFMALATVVWRLGKADMESIQGLGRRMPLTFAALLIGGLSLIGVPLTAGFISKWYLVVAALQAGLWWVAALILLGSLLALVYVWRIVEAGWFKEVPAGSVPLDQAGRLEAPLWLLVPTWILVLANIWFGISTKWPLTLSAMSANVLSGGG